jgi:glycerophosphoryl diester phosphodiesterase/membrane-anchored protein YejM (alkaline phosphatase superfamily)
LVTAGGRAGSDGGTQKMIDRQVLAKICFWAVFWGIGIAVLKFVVFYVHGVSPTPPYLAGTTLSIFGNIVWGVLIGFLLFSNALSIRLLGFSIAAMTVMFYIASFHYELYFRTLPDPGFFYYLKELPYLMPSLKSNAPIAFFLLELFLGAGLVFGGKLLADRFWERFQILRSYAFHGGLILLGVAIPLWLHLFPNAVDSDPFYWGSRNPILWLSHSSILSARQDRESFTPYDIWNYQKELGHRTPAGGQNLVYPLCSGLKNRLPSSFDNRSVILLILESVGNQEIFMKIDEKPLMPNLSKIAEENLFFSNVCSGGTKSNQILPAIFSGIPPQTYMNILWQKPLPRLDGFPALLRRAGYQTSYFHGSDLSFEQQRSFLKMVGFEHIFDYDPALEKDVGGWGYDDREMFSSLRNWISRLDESKRPYFTALFTLSTHDPFVLPPDWEGTFTGKRTTFRKNGTWLGVTQMEDRYELFIESLHFLDHEIGKFYKWYQKKEKPQGTLLVILGDHITSLHNEAKNIEEQHMRFFVPLIFAGLPPKQLNTYRKYRERRGSLYDLPSTMAGLLGLESQPCDQGINLLEKGSRWPENRLVYAVGGQNLERLYFWTNRAQIVYDRMRKRFDVVNDEMPENTTRADIQEVEQIIETRIFPFMKILLPLNKYLVLNNAYTPSRGFGLEPGVPIPRVDAPIFISHRGNTAGSRIPVRQNKGDAIKAAIEAGFEWVEVDVHLTEDGIPVLIHDSFVLDAEGNPLQIKNMSLSELKTVQGYGDLLTLEEALDAYLDKIGFAIELKTEPFIDRNLILNRKVLKLIQDHPARGKIIVDSFNELSAKFIKTRCDCSVGLDTPYQKPLTRERLHSIRFSGLDWVYVHHSVVDQKMVRDAHEAGLKVMAYTVNDPSIIDQWRSNLPDGIITDDVRIKNEFLDSLLQR